jgi:hypothetical protein
MPATLAYTLSNGVDTLILRYRSGRVTLDQNIDDYPSSQVFTGGLSV